MIFTISPAFRKALRYNGARWDLATTDQPVQASNAPEAALHPRTLLQRISPLELTLESNGQVLISHAGGSPQRYGLHALPLLHAFAQPAAFGDVLAALRPSNITGWMDLSSTALDLYRTGILVPPGTKPLPHESGFGNPEIHRRMLNDRRRTDSFRQAIREAVKPGDTVVEIGCGSGVLTLAAVEAGARHVYAIEASAIADAAEQIFQQAGVADRVTLLRGWSTNIELPERADVIIAEIIGNDPLGESALQYLTDARRRMARPNARFVPDYLRVLAVPVTIPDDVVQARVITPDVLANWSEWYGISFSPLAQRTSYNHRPFHWIKPQHTSEWARLAAPVPLLHFDFASSTPRPIEGEVFAEATASGVWNGVMLCFSAGLGSIDYATTPAEARVDNSWSSPLWYFEQPMEVQQGSRFGISYRYGANSGGWLFRPIPATNEDVPQ